MSSHSIPTPSSIASPSLPAINTELNSFQELQLYIQQSNYILVLLGAGLSQPSGVPTFRGPNRIWRGRDSSDFAQPRTFEQDPVLVWVFYESRRQIALRARPNAGHFALAELAHKKRNMLTITQNIDGLSERAGHCYPKLIALHGSLFSVRCSNDECSFRDVNHNLEPTVPGLVLPPNIEDEHVPLPAIDKERIPKCPICKDRILRPGVVWYSEKLPVDLLGFVDAWLELVPRIDLMLVVGTTRGIFISDALHRGARVAYVDMEEMDNAYDPGAIVTEVDSSGDWHVTADAARALPLLCCGW